ncbi:AarF/ABC1/UbiB kinase family protein [Mycolicibacterium fluoranthenivorans]|uniref:AarF/ABC1/UbiB kinase family protein n=2 Tax=Mycolicibacterium fluoranthenivorans TaxID=258505 RepID=A0A7G8PKL5_9MYCO|nr:AarF/ABC1/UbiB kinase family protein [Mycolicibacterium fluoranthenivorans]QNJ94881.1 AarF/ABC1/UbiB kinase family protein [Mycolicibacterium fluoranthenivorans]
MPLAGFTARAAGGRLIAGLREKAGDEGAVEQFHDRTAERYAQLLGHSKGALMKIGQMLSMVEPGGLGTGGFAPYQQALVRLQSAAPPMGRDLVSEQLDAELGSATSEFVEFDEHPVAAASIGQVHRARLSDGRVVAVKIQYPGVAQAIRDDLANTELVATFLRFVTSASGIVMDPRPLAQELTARISEEVDYVLEAQMITRFADLYRGHPFIRIPDVITELSTTRVLTMTYLDGLDWSQAQSADQDLKNTWAEVITRFTDGNYRHANLMHTDPHPGNYRFGLDGTVGVVDFGSVKVLPEVLRRAAVGVMRHAIDGRTDELRACMVDVGFITADSTLTEQEALAYWSQVFYEVALAPQPVTYTAADSARTARWLFGLHDSNNPLTRMHAPSDMAFTPRVHMALSNVCSGLGATVPARSITDDMDGIIEPVTELGKRHHAWVRERCLPSSFDDHDAVAGRTRC